MPQDSIVELQIGQNGNLVTGDVFVDYTAGTINGTGLYVSIANQLVALDGLLLHDNMDGTYTITGASAAVGTIPAASVSLTYTSINPATLSAAATILGTTTTQAEVVLGTAVTCFASGTLIATEDGDIAVERLEVGQRASTSSGELRKIKWLGHRTVQCRSHPRPHEAMPVRIAAHAFADNRPARDLWVSPGHSICVDVDQAGEVLIAASALINGATVQQVEVEEVTYWHVELDSHDILIADGMPAESYLEMSNRGFFAEGGVVALGAPPDADASKRTHADFCRAYHEGGPVVETIKARLCERAKLLGWRLAYQVDCHLEVDGRRVDAVMRGAVARFHLPAKAKEVWLVSATARPCDTLGSPDVRELGLQLASVRIDDGLAPPRDVPIDDPLFCIGFHAVEEGAYRWTVGRALLPAALWETCEDDFYLRLELAGPPIPRWMRPQDVRAALALVS